MGVLPGSCKTDLDRRIWLLRIHDYGLVWLHIHELVFDLLHRLQEKFLRFFRRVESELSPTCRRTTAALPPNIRAYVMNKREKKASLLSNHPPAPKLRRGRHELAQVIS